jgi:hypothetical protein
MKISLIRLSLRLSSLDQCVGDQPGYYYRYTKPIRLKCS